MTYIRYYSRLLAMALCLAMLLGLAAFPAAADSDPENGVVLTKTAAYDAQTETTTVTLESYVTGTVKTATKPCDIVLVLDVSGSMANKFGAETTRLEALKTAVRSFIGTVADTADAGHRIAVVSFANEAKTELNLTATDTAGRQTLEECVKDLTMRSGTRPDAGLAVAKTILPAKTPDRSQVVVLFTDGCPTQTIGGWTSGGFYDDSASEAIRLGGELERAGAQVYTVAVNSDASTAAGDMTGSSNKAKLNRFLQYASSNYPNATDLNTAGADTVTDKCYYMVASSPAGLSHIFSSIASASTNAALTGAAVLSDIVSPYFDCGTVGSIRAYTCGYRGNGAWGERSDAPQVIGSLSGRAVSVTGFDYAANCVVEEQPTGGTMGAKLVVEIPITYAGGFGGYLPTNSAAAIYDKADGTAVETVQTPLVEIPVQGEVTPGTPSKVYDGTGIDLRDLLELPGSLPEDASPYQLDGIANAGVTLTYEIVNADGTTAATYAVAAGATSGSWTYADPAAAATPADAGTYPYTVRLTVKSTGDADNTEIFSKAATAVIIPRPAVIKVNSTSVTYRETPAFSGSVTGLLNGEDLGTITYVRRGTQTAVGAYPEELWADYTENGNYVVTVQPGDLTITPSSALTVSASDEKIPYDGSAHGVEAVSAPEAKILYSTDDGHTYTSETSPTYTNRGVYKVYFQASDANYVTAYGTANVEITPRPAVISVQSADKYYGEADPAFGGSVDGVLDGDSLAVSYYRKNPTENDVGVYKGVLSARYEPNNNYAVTVTNGDFTIAAADTMTVQADNVTQVYDGTGYGVKAESNVDDAEIRYWNEKTGAYDLKSSPTYASVGSYSIGFQATQKNFETVTGTATLTITKRPATITVAPATMVYGGALPTFYGRVTGLVDDLDLGTITYHRQETNTAAGVYEKDLWADYVENGNYQVTVVPGTFTITPSPQMTVGAESVEKTYDGNAWGVTAAANVETADVRYWNEETGAYDLEESPVFTAPGTYGVTFQATDGNHVPATGVATIRILPAEITLTAGDASAVYDGNTQTVQTALAVTGGKLAVGDSVTGAASGSGLHVGVYPITAQADQTVIKNAAGQIVTDCYRIRYEAGTLRIGGSGLTLNREDHIRYIQGYPSGAFCQERNMTRAEAAVMFSRLITSSFDAAGTEESPFSDVQTGAWYYDAVCFMAEHGVILGYTDGTFRPDAPITRAEFATICTRFDAAMNYMPGTLTATFSDLEPTDWAYGAVMRAAARGWVTGYPDGTFRPNVNITRAEVVSVVNRVLERSADQAYLDDAIQTGAADFKRYTDMEPGDWAYYDVYEASNAHDYEKDADGAETWLRHWTDLYTLSFHISGGTADTAAVFNCTAQVGAQITLPSAADTAGLLSGILLGWSLQEDGTDGMKTYTVAAQDAFVSQNGIDHHIIHLYAVWS